jgi:acetyl esterase/lipase
VKVSEKCISAASDALTAQLGREGVKQVGGVLWWRWRRPKSEVKAEWIEMRGNYNARRKRNEVGNRVMLYVHGGAYFFGSVDEHRYQMQRHARKLRAKVFAPRYRLAPQFPFPCGLHDCLAAYLYLLTVHSPTEIILAGDSAGGGMVVSMLVTLRDQELPLPAGAVLISPWVDLTHSFPSLAGDNKYDYIPAHGFMQRPSMSWPPPNADEMESICKGAVKHVACEELGKHPARQAKKDAGNAAVQGFTIHHDEIARSKQDGAAESTNTEPKGEPTPSPGHNLSISFDGNLIDIKDQIQMYACNHLLSHPLVSPVLQPSLGGLPPLLILTGGGEMLRDEQIYLAHKAASPSKYPPSTTVLDTHDSSRTLLNKYKPTDVQLQVWDDLCHVAPTLSFTRPAKFMYRSIAQFGAWALARAQKTEIEILDDDDVSIISSGSNTDSDTDSDAKTVHKDITTESSDAPVSQVGKAGDPLPHFRNHMIRQRVDRHGAIYPLASASSLPACQMIPDEVGAIKPGPVRKWMAAKKEWDSKYVSDRRRVQKRRVKEMAAGGYETFEGNEVPPPSALAGRRRKGMETEMEAEKLRKSWGMSLWSLWGSKHDQTTIKREEKADANPEVPVVTTTTMADVAGKTRSVTAPSSLPVTEVAATRPRGFSLTKLRPSDSQSRSRSRRRTVTDTGQADERPDLELLLDGPGESESNVDDTSRARSSTEPAQSSSLLSPSYIPAIVRNKRPDLAAEVSASLSKTSRNLSTPAVMEASGIYTPLSRSSSGNGDDASSIFDATKLRAPGLGIDRNPSAVAVMGHEGVCIDLGHEHEADQEFMGRDVRFDPLGMGRENASTMCVAEEEGFMGIGYAEGEKSEVGSMVGAQKYGTAAGDGGEVENDDATGDGEQDDLDAIAGRKNKTTRNKAEKMLGGLGKNKGKKGQDLNGGPSGDTDEEDLFDILASISAANGTGRMQGQSWDPKKKAQERKTV